MKETRSNEYSYFLMVDNEIAGVISTGKNPSALEDEKALLSITRQATMHSKDNPHDPIKIIRTRIQMTKVDVTPLFLAASTDGVSDNNPIWEKVLQFFLLFKADTELKEIELKAEEAKNNAMGEAFRSFGGLILRMIAEKDFSIDIAQHPFFAQHPLIDGIKREASSVKESLDKARRAKGEIG